MRALYAVSIFKYFPSRQGRLVMWKVILLIISAVRVSIDQVIDSQSRWHIWM